VPPETTVANLNNNNNIIISVMIIQFLLNNLTFLDVFAKQLRKANFSFVICLHRHGTKRTTGEIFFH
jgi:hypothetical protein